MNLTHDIERRIRVAILAGASDDDIATALALSVKVVRPIRREIEAAQRPQ